MRHPGHAGGQRHRGTAGRARRRHPCVPGIARRPEDLVEGIGAGAELRRVRHGIDDAALAFEMGDEHVGVSARCDPCKMGEPCVERTPATSVRSLIGTGRPASTPRSSIGLAISCRACSRARSKQRVGSALTMPSTAAMRVSSASRQSSGEIDPALRPSTICVAVMRIRSDMRNSLFQRRIESVCRHPVNRRKRPPSFARRTS